MQSPPTRYQVIERGRRLVAIDSLTGKEFGLGNSGALEGQKVGSRQTGQAPTTPKLPQKNPSKLDPDIGKAVGNMPRITRIIIMIIVAALFAILLISSGLWVAFVVLMFVAPVRSAIFAAAKEAVKRILAVDPGNS